MLNYFLHISYPSVKINLIGVQINFKSSNFLFLILTSSVKIHCIVVCALCVLRAHKQ